MRQDLVFQIVTRIPFFSMAWLCFLNVDFTLSALSSCRKMAVSSSWGYILLGSCLAEKVSQYYKQNFKIHWTRLAWFGIRVHPWIPWSWREWVCRLTKASQELGVPPPTNGWKLQYTVRRGGKGREALTIVSPNETFVLELFVTNLNSC